MYSKHDCSINYKLYRTDCNLESLHVIMIIIIIKFTYGSTGSVSRIFVLLMISGSV